MSWTPPPGYNPYAAPHTAANPYDTQAQWNSQKSATTNPPAANNVPAVNNDQYAQGQNNQNVSGGIAMLPTGSAETVGQVFSQNTDDAGFGFGAKSAGYTGAQGATAVSNVGSPYNSNMLTIDPSQKSQYKYTNTFSNSSDKPQTYTVWNKTGPDGQPNSGMTALGKPITFTLQPGQAQTMAFDSGSSVGWAAGNSNGGQTWGEATFGNGGAGWDISQISPAGSNGNMKITNQATGSSITNANAYTDADQSSVGKDQWVTPGTPLDLLTTVT